MKGGGRNLTDDFLRFMEHYRTVKTNRYGRFLLNKGLHKYSAAPKYANKYVLVKLTAFHVIVLDESYREIVCHERLYDDHRQQSTQWLSYLNQLARCPGALKYTGIYQMLPQPVKEYMVLAMWTA
jgi:hypothetical protein